jgi:hypothetical protein
MTPGLMALVLVLGGLGGSLVVMETLRLAAADNLHVSYTGLPGSTFVGAAERVVIIGALSMGLSDVAAVVLAVKALGQYAETHQAHEERSNHGAAARVLGTLVSLAWALACFAVIQVATDAR